MNRRDLFFGILALVIIVGVIFWSRRGTTPGLTPTPTPTTQEVIEDRFNVQIPEDVTRTNLKDVTGGDSLGIATVKFEAGSFEHGVLANLPEPKVGEFYEGWLVRGKEGDSNFSIIPTGKLRIAKGGYLLEFNSKKDYSDHKGVVITLEKVDDKKPEVHVLEGSF